MRPSGPSPACVLRIGGVQLHLWHPGRGPGPQAQSHHVHHPSVALTATHRRPPLSMYAHTRIMGTSTALGGEEHMYGQREGDELSNQLGINNSVYTAHMKQAVAEKAALVSDAETKRQS